MPEKAFGGSVPSSIRLAPGYGGWTPRNPCWICPRFPATAWRRYSVTAPKPRRDRRGWPPAPSVPAPPVMAGFLVSARSIRHIRRPR